VQEPTPIPQPQEQPRRKRKIWKIILIGFGIFIGVLLLLAVLIPLLFEDKIKALFVAELNKSLATPVTIDEENIHVSLLKHFPEASVIFNEVGIRESFPNAQKNFLEANEISLLFNFWDIVHGNYTIEHIVVKDGFCHLITDKKGNINYKFWKESEDTSSSAFQMQLDKVDLQNVDIRYLDYVYNQDIQCLVNTCAFTGNFTDAQYTMQATGNVLSKRIRIGSDSYLVNKETDIDTKLLVDVAQDAYTFEGGSITVDQNTFLLNGSIKLAGDDYYDLHVQGDEINLSGLLLLLPGSISSNLETLKTTGDIDFSTNIVGYYTKTKNPQIDIDFSVRDGSIKHQKFGGELDDMSFTGKFTNGAKQHDATSSIRIQNFQATRDGQPLSMSLTYTNFSNPYIDLALNGQLPASLIIPMAMPEAKNVEGMIALNQIAVKGNIRSFNASASEAPPTGEIAFSDVAFELHDQRVAIPFGTAIVSNNTINLKQITLEAAGSTLFTDLEISNWIQHVFPTTNTPALFIDGTVKADKFDVNGLLALTGSSVAAKTTEATESAPSTTETSGEPLDVSGRIALTCGSLLYDNLKLENVRTEVKLAPGLVILNGISGGTMDGTFDMQASFRTLPNGDFMLQTSGQLNSIDVQELFRQLDNFEQDDLTDKHLRGKITANIYDVTIRWDKGYSLIENSVYVLCDMRIENGELIDYKPLESLSAFVKLSDLKHITFNTLENKIEIKDRVISLPAMQIKSNALDLYMSGKHTFDNKLDYQFRLSLADLMVRKYLGGNKQKENYEEDAEGGVNIYVSMTGTVDDPIMAYNKREAKQKLQESGLEEHRFIDIFKPDPDESLFKETETPKDDKQDETDPEELEFIDFEEDE